MKKTLFLLLAFLMPMMMMMAQDTTAKVRWGTFNIRLRNAGDDKAGWGWEVRRDRVAKYVNDNHLDIVGMQEVTHPQLVDLLQRMPDYDYVGVGRTDGKEKGEYSPVFFRRDKFEVLEKGNFWLSETPDVAGSKGWDAAIERVASYAKLRDKASGKVFMAVNTHFDHVGVQARRESALLIMKKIKQIVGDRPAVLTGDFNITEADPAYTTLTTSPFKFYDAYHHTAHHTGTTYTFQNFSRISPLEAEKIDFIFVTPSIKVQRTHIQQDNPQYIMSDHNPHWADLVF